MHRMYVDIQTREAHPDPDGHRTGCGQGPSWMARWALSETLYTCIYRAPLPGHSAVWKANKR